MDAGAKPTRSPSPDATTFQAPTTVGDAVSPEGRLPAKPSRGGESGTPETWDRRKGWTSGTCRTAGCPAPAVVLADVAGAQAAWDHAAVIFRPAVAEDVPALVEVQEAGAVLGLGHIFPQHTHPFPRHEITARWLSEIADPETHVYVCTDEFGAITGFAATRGDELLHFGTAPATWGQGLASALHSAVLAVLCETAGSPRARLRVFEDNHRARRFYEKHGWRTTGTRSRSPFEPHPELLEYERPLGAADRRAQ
jgi:RimJ/RimL family protein N-acetyltransferase